RGHGPEPAHAAPADPLHRQTLLAQPLLPRTALRAQAELVHPRRGQSTHELADLVLAAGPRLARVEVQDGEASTAVRRVRHPPHPPRAPRRRAMTSPPVRAGPYIGEPPALHRDSNENG